MGYRRCEAKTRKGVQCKGGAMTGSPHCGAHQHIPVVPAVPMASTLYREIESFVTKTVGDMITLEDGTVTVTKPAIELQNWFTTHRMELLERYGHPKTIARSNGGGKH